MSTGLLYRFHALPAVLLMTALWCVMIGCRGAAKDQPQSVESVQQSEESGSPASSEKSTATEPGSVPEPSSASEPSLAAPPAAEPAPESTLSPEPALPQNDEPATEVSGQQGTAASSSQESDSGSVGTGADDELIEQSLATLKKGNLAYNTPERMKTGSTARVTARIGAGDISVQTLESGMPADQGTKTEAEQTPVSTKMKMTLKSADFDITPLSSEEQIVGGDTPTEWEWDIAPKHSGTSHLHLAAVVELRNISRDFTTVDRDIAVQVDPIDAVTKFVQANGVWILTTLGAGIAGLWAWLKKRKKAKTPSWETP